MNDEIKVIPKVINISTKYLRKIGYKTLEDWLKADKKHIYIGRDMQIYVSGAKGSKWQNPYPTKKYGLDVCLAKYEEYVRNNTILMDEIKELNDCTLGCWCKSNSSLDLQTINCHGDILIKIYQELFIKKMK